MRSTNCGIPRIVSAISFSSLCAGTTTDTRFPSSTVSGSPGSREASLGCEKQARQGRRERSYLEGTGATEDAAWRRARGESLGPGGPLKRGYERERTAREAGSKTSAATIPRIRPISAATSTVLRRLRAVVFVAAARVVICGASTSLASASCCWLVVSWSVVVSSCCCRPFSWPSAISRSLVERPEPFPSAACCAFRLVFSVLQGRLLLVDLQLQVGDLRLRVARERVREDDRPGQVVGGARHRPPSVAGDRDRDERVLPQPRDVAGHGLRRDRDREAGRAAGRVASDRAGSSTRR